MSTTVAVFGSKILSGPSFYINCEIVPRPGEEIIITGVGSFIVESIIHRQCNGPVAPNSPLYNVGIEIWCEERVKDKPSFNEI